MDGLELKLATIDDFPAIEQVGDRLFDHKIKTNRTIEFLNDSRHHLVLAYYQGHIIGMASAIDYVHPDKDPALFIDEVAVLDDFQNKGIGSSLVRYLCQYGKSLGCNVAWVATEASNAAARKAYLNAGGKEDPEPVVLIEFDLD